MDGVASTGSSSERARLDHVHPSDTSKASLSDLAPVALSGDYDDLENKPTIPEASTATPLMDGTAAVGTDDGFSRGDHVHPTDTSRLSTTGNAYRAASIPYGECDNTSTATAFTVTVPGVTELRDGVCCYVRNNVITSAANCTLDVNGLGAKPMYSSMAAASRVTTLFNINYTFLFVYNTGRVSGGCWDVYYGYDSNSNTIGYQLRTNSTAQYVSDTLYRYRLLFTSADGQKLVPANTTNSSATDTLKTTNQRPIDPWGPIRYYGTTGSVTAGNRVAATSVWQQYKVNIGNSFNRTGSNPSMTQWAPVYVKCAPQSDGSAIMDANTPYVQSLPSTADGNIYIFLGIAISATEIELVLEHPVYCFRNGGIQLWTGVQLELDALAARVALLET